MFARSNLVQTVLAKSAQENQKSDADLLEEIRSEKKQVTVSHDTKNHKGFILHYVQFSNQVREFTHGKYSSIFAGFVIFMIAMAGIIIGIGTYPGMSDDPTLDALDVIVSTSFALETAMKIIAEGADPIHFFSGEDRIMNNIDFAVVILCFPYISNYLLGNSGAIRIVTRLFRLVRLSKIVNQIPALRVIVRGLMGGLKAITYIAVLMILFLYLFAVLGVYLFRDNDPFFFGSISTALLCLFHAMTLDSWGDNLRINAYGCDVYDAGIYVLKSDYINSSSMWNKIPDMYKCTSPEQQPFVSAVYWLTFISIASLILLSLFVGIITMSMQESLDEMRKETGETHRKKILIKSARELDELVAKANCAAISESLIHDHIDHHHGQQLHTFRPSMLHHMIKPVCLSNDDLQAINDDPQSIDPVTDDTRTRSSIAHRVSILASKIVETLLREAQKKKNNANKAMSIKQKLKVKGMREMQALLAQSWEGIEMNDNTGEGEDSVKTSKFRDFLEYLAVKAHIILEHQYFHVFMIAVIVFAAVLVGVETDYEPTTPEVATVYFILDNMIFTIFSLEILLRLGAEEFIFYDYIKQSWNCFDFAVVLTSQIPGGGVFITILRLVRILRVLKLVNVLPGLAVIVNALLIGLVSIGYIGVIIALTFFLFSILAMILFKDNDAFHFGDLHTTLFTLFDVATLDNWGVVMYTQVYGCDVFPLFDPGYPPGWCVNPSPMGLGAVAFFVIFIVIGALVMLTLFVGVVSTSMEEASKQQLLEKEIEARVQELSSALHVNSKQIEIYRRVFGMLDMDNGGTIEKEELKIGLSFLNQFPTEAELDTWIKEVDINADGVIDLAEFITFMVNVRSKIKEREAAKKKTAESVRKASMKFLKSIKNRDSSNKKERPKMLAQMSSMFVVGRKYNKSKRVPQGSMVDDNVTALTYDRFRDENEDSVQVMRSRRNLLRQSFHSSEKHTSGIFSSLSRCLHWSNHRSSGINGGGVRVGLHKTSVRRTSFNQVKQQQSGPEQDFSLLTSSKDVTSSVNPTEVYEVVDVEDDIHNNLSSLRMYSETAVRNNNNTLILKNEVSDSQLSMSHTSIEDGNMSREHSSNKEYMSNSDSAIERKYEKIVKYSSDGGGSGANSHFKVHNNSFKIDEAV